ncbi:MAG TPA: Hpt domain-containing protein [Thermoleophilaceae bacterium]|nr:Hpt domain-containing protein [Thermoleophilaceae bacterium]
MDIAAIDVLRKTVGDDSAFLAEITASFLEDSGAQLEQLRAAAEGDDAATTRRAAHTLKSNAATFGLTEVEALCRELEQRASEGDMAGAADSVAAIGAALQEGHAALREALPEAEA